ncbi:MAG: hypothetical protein ACU0CI_06660 [Shimia sp.]
MILSTHAEHTGARALYDRAGFVCAHSAPVLAYGVPMTHEDWRLELTP